MKLLLQYSAAFLLLITSAFAGKAVNISGETGIALQGYDPVAFFTIGKPTHGDPGIRTEYQGATYLFSSEMHLKMFQKDPEKYAPQFGGYCAYGVSVNALFPVDINTAQVVDDKLYLNLNPKILTTFNQDFEKNVAKAHKNWPTLIAEKDSSEGCSHCRAGSKRLRSR